MSDQNDLANRLHEMLRKINLSDESIVNGVSLTDAGFQKVANKLGIEPSEVQLLLKVLVTRLRDEKNSLDQIQEDYGSTGSRFTFETDLNKNVTIRDSETGTSIFIRGSDASSLLNQLKNADEDTQQQILSSYGSWMTEAVKPGERAMNSWDEDPEREADHSKALDKTGFWGAQAAGCIILAKSTGRILIAHRSGAVLEPHTWGSWGGAIDPGEDPKEATVREVYEEAGYTGHIDSVVPLYVFRKETFRYSNFLVVVDDEFAPDLNWESQGFKWCEYGHWPSPLHFGLKALFADAASVKRIEKVLANLKPQGSAQIEESVGSILDESFDDEIAQTGGTFNFPWKIEGRHGLATARYKGRGPEMDVTVMSIRDTKGNEIMTPELGDQIQPQAVTFIGNE